MLGWERRLAHSEAVRFRGFAMRFNLNSRPLRSVCAGTSLVPLGVAPLATVHTRRLQVLRQLL